MSYSTHLKTYMSFCALMGYSPVPVLHSTVLRYVAYLSQKMAPQSIRSYLNVIRLLHLESNLSNPLEHNFALDTLLKGIKRDKGVCVKQALPITPQLLIKMYQVIDLSSPFGSVFWSACLVGFFAFLRKSNLFYHTGQSHHLMTNNVLVTPTNQVYLQVMSTKTIQCKEKVLLLPLPPIPGHILCPVAALKHMWSFAQLPSEPIPLFSYHTPLGYKSVTYCTFLKHLRVVLEKVGVQANQFSGHSLRRGGASYALSIGIPGEVIKILGDWKSDCYQRYLDTSIHTRFQSISYMATCLPHNA